MNKREKLLQAYIDIYNAVEFSDSMLRAACEPAVLESDRAEWLINGALEQMDKIRKSLESIDEVMSGKAVAA